MELQEIFALMDRFDASGLGSLALTMGDTKLVLQKSLPTPAVAAPAVLRQETAPQPAPPPQETAAGSLLEAPLVGTFFLSSAPGETPFATVGQTVQKGETLCLIEAMKMMNKIPAPMDCVIAEILVKDGGLVGYGTPLFRYLEV